LKELISDIETDVDLRLRKKLMMKKWVIESAKDMVIRIQRYYRKRMAKR
jgi:hypothetical protein